MKIRREILIGIVVGAITSIGFVAASDSSFVDAQMMMGQGSSSGTSHSGGSSEMHGSMHVPGSVKQICHESSSMPPHYCEPVYKTMSSVKGIRISTVDLVDDKTMSVILRQIGSSASSVDQKIVVVGGSGHLAGASIVEGGWSGSTTVTVPFNGMGTFYDHKSSHLHLFPVTNG